MHDALRTVAGDIADHGQIQAQSGYGNYNFTCTSFDAHHAAHSTIIYVAFVACYNFTSTIMFNSHHAAHSTITYGDVTYSALRR